jgi:hypothetical protein
VDNRVGAVDTAVRFLKKPFAELDQLDLTPAMTLAGSVWPETLDLAALPDADLDVDGHRRTAPTLGACAAQSPTTCPRRLP